MNKLLKILLIVLLMPVSCTTLVKFNVEHGPVIDFYDSITVIPFEWNNYNDTTYAYVAKGITKALLDGIERIGAYNLVDPDNLIDIDRSDYHEFVDVYIIGEIKDIDTKDEEEKRGEDIYINRTVTVKIEYSYIRSSNNEVLGVFTKKSSESASFKKDEKLGWIILNFIIDVILDKDTSTISLASSSVRQFSLKMREELIPHRSMETRNIEESKNKDPRFKKAKKLVREKKLSEAIEVYKEIHEQTGSAVAGYNMAILLQAEGQFIEAMDILVDLDARITRSGIDTPQFIENEIKELKELIAGFERTEKYRNR